MSESRLQDIMDRMFEERMLTKEYSDEEKLRAAYALNMCMVSISQIIDYDDLYILEQEYEGILNNINIEMMPKDEALLKIIKQILDTITFFRIQDGDKQIVDREYQQRMKNAIWSAVPNFGMIVAGGNAVTMVVSLASQVGIGYMNYRRVKSENTLNYDKQMWQLQRSAIEQFNGLRRELFDTAWRLADTYGFPDEYRLTERQIKQYNEILMDSDEIRKYERLTSIKERFIAYPPFWYQYGSTANHIARNMELPLSPEARQVYTAEALDCFDKYWISNKYPLLREDLTASACALEQIDLLDIQKDKDKISELLDKAIKFSGDSNDILELCAMAYIRIGKLEEAGNILRVLVNEDYNKTVNAQLLSAIYVNMIIKNKLEYIPKYELLATRVNPDYLFKNPSNYAEFEELETEFLTRQEEIITEQYKDAIKQYIKSIGICLAKIIPDISEGEVHEDSYYSFDGLAQRLLDFELLFRNNNQKKIKYLDRLSQCDYIGRVFEILNQMFEEITELNGIRDWQKLHEVVENMILTYKEEINELNRKLENQEVSIEDLYRLFELPTILLREFAKELISQINCSILGMEQMMQYAKAETELYNFCISHDITWNEFSTKNDNNNITRSGIKTFSIDILGEEGRRYQKRQERCRKVEEILRNEENVKKFETISEKSAFYLKGSDEFRQYMDKHRSKCNSNILQNTLAVLDDKSLHNTDCLFTTDEIIPIIRGSVKTAIPYVCLSSGETRSRLLQAVALMYPNDVSSRAKVFALTAIAPGLVTLARGGVAMYDSKAIESVIKKTQDIIDKICEIIIKDMQEESS